MSPKRTKILHTIINLIIIVVTLLLFAVVYQWGQANPNQPTQLKSGQLSDVPMVELVNKVRAAHSVEPLVEDPALVESARLKAKEIVETGYFEHTSKDGKPFSYYLKMTKPGMTGWGENLAKCYVSQEKTIEGWENSPGHLANMIETRFTLYGSYTMWDNVDKCLVTVDHFGRG